MILDDVAAASRTVDAFALVRIQVEEFSENALVVQRIERDPATVEAIGSNPIGSAISCRLARRHQGRSWTVRASKNKYQDSTPAASEGGGGLGEVRCLHGNNTTQ